MRHRALIPLAGIALGLWPAFCAGLLSAQRRTRPISEEVGFKIF